MVVCVLRDSSNKYSNNHLNKSKFYSCIQRGFWYLECVMGVVGGFAHVWEGFAGEVIIELVIDV